MSDEAQFVGDFIEVIDKTNIQRKDQFKQSLYKTYPNGLDQYKKTYKSIGVKPSIINAFADAGFVLQPKQLEFIKYTQDIDVWDAPPEVGIGGARGGGKSFLVFALVCLYECMRIPNAKWLYLRKTAKASGEQIEDMAKRVFQFVHGVEVKRNRIDFPNGSRLIIGGFNNDAQALAYQGIEYDGMIIEELTQLSESTYLTLRLSLRTAKDYRPRAYVSFNPLGIGHQWVYKRFVKPHQQKYKGEHRKAVTRFVPALVTDNRFVNDDYISNLDDLTGAELQAYRYGRWDISAGAYFSEWDTTRHVIPKLESIPDDWEVWISCDYGFNHPNVFLFFARDGDGVVRVIDELWHTKHYPDEIAPMIVTRLKEWGRSFATVNRCYVGQDAYNSTGRSRDTIVQQYAKHGVPMTKAYTAGGSRVQGAHHILKLLGNHKRDIPPKLLVSENCKMLIEQMPYLERSTSNSEDVQKRDMDNDNPMSGDDAYDALRYGIYRPHASTIA